MDITQPMPKRDFNVQYVCRYECEIDRQMIFDAQGHYIEEVLGTRDVLFVKIQMEAVNKVFKLHHAFVGEEIEFKTDYRKNNVVRVTEISGDDLPPLWAVLVNEESNVRLIQTIEPSKFIIRKTDIDKLIELLAAIELAPKEYNHEALKVVHWNDTTKSLRQDIEFFVAARRWFKEKGLPYNRSYLLHGPPGNGKTTTIKAISKFLNAKPELFDFVAQYQSPDKSFQAWVLGESERIAQEEDETGEDSIAALKYEDVEDEDESDGPTPIRLLVLEDIDRFFPKDGPPQTSVSLSCILNSLDGSVERRNTIIIATANHPENIDQQVLARPGRFDKQVFYENPDSSNGLAYLKRLFCNEQVTDGILETAVKEFSGHSYALHRELFTTSASYAFTRGSRTIEDDDVSKGLADLVRSIDKNVMKSARDRLGFGS